MRPSARLGWAVVSVALTALTWWVLRRPEGASFPLADAKRAVAARGDDAESSAESRPPVVRIEPARTTTLAPTIVPRCAGIDAEPIGPSLADTANVLLGELWDRTRHLLGSGEGSPELREGLQALLRHDTARALTLLRDAPDRHADGFDLATAAAFAQTIRALGEERGTAEALSALEEVEGAGPLGPLARALVARQGGDDAAELAALSEAFARSEDPAIAFALATTATRNGRSALALEALRAYARDYPDDPWAEGMLPLLERRAAAEASMAELEHAGVRLRYPRSFARAEELHQQVLEGLGAAGEMLGTERRPILTVVLYPSREVLLQATCGPEWTGGLYDGSLRLDGGAEPSRLATTVRHESLHAQLAYVAPRAPLWLHEGLAQVMEGRVPADLERTLSLMARERTYVPFASLEGSFVVIDDAESARFAYHQSYAMVAALLEREGPDALRRAVAHLSGGGDPRALLQAMTTRPFTGDELLDWVAQR